MKKYSYVKIHNDPNVIYEITDEIADPKNLAIYIGDELAPCPKGVRQKK